jgi:hypothetical protein
VSDIRMKRGDSTPFKFQVKDANDVPVDVTGADFWWTAKDRVADADNVAVIAKTKAGGGIVVTNQTLGQAEVRLVPADTSGFTDNRVLLWDLQIKDQSGKVQTLDSGKLTVVADVTRTS